MKTPLPIQLICLDLGGVMIRIASGWQEACRRADVPAPIDMQSPANMPALMELNYLHETGRISDEDFAFGIAQRIGLSPEQVMSAIDAWLLGPYPGAGELMLELAVHSKCRAACLSNTNRRHWSLMNQVGGKNHLPLMDLHARYTSFDLESMKPDAEIYRRVEQASGVQPAAILFFDDYPANIQTALDRGWNAHRIDPTTGDSPSQVRRHLISLGLLDKTSEENRPPVLSSLKDD